jgi:hypothetical protein
MTYNNFKELYGGILKYNDIINFHYYDYTLKYRVTHNYLYLEDITPRNSYAQHDFIFKLLSLNPHETCDLIYKTKGADYDHCIFPETKKEDYESLTNIALFLFSKIENINFKEYYNVWED